MNDKIDVKYVGTLRDEVALRVRDLWRCLQTREDLLRLVNVVLDGLYGPMAQHVDMAQLMAMACTPEGEYRYTTFQIPKKKKGTFRTIDAPIPPLKNLQRALNAVLQTVYTPHCAATGFVTGRSVLDNARAHVAQRYIYNIDLKDFFPSIRSGRVFACLMSKRLALPPALASLVSDLCCYVNGDGNKVLPQGAPTSPVLSNIVCERLDRKLQKLAKAYGLRYTRYADDITFSGNTYVFATDGRFCTLLKHIVEDEEGFVIYADKTRLEHRGMRQETTGLTVNEKPNVPRTYVKQLRMLLHNWEMNGYKHAQVEFRKRYVSTKYLQYEGPHHLENIIAGKLYYLKMVKGETDATYRKLLGRFNHLMQSRRDYIKNKYGV